MDHPEDEPITEDAMFLLASQTKLLASIAALQIVDRGLFGLDDDVSEKLPELAAQPILEGFDEDNKPILVKRENLITLRYVRIQYLFGTNGTRRLISPQTPPHPHSRCWL